jgi:ABC-type phosphate transport system substrate-binding protein
MKRYRSTVLALACCAASVSGAACTAGISTATTAPATSAPAPSHSASVAVSSPSPASSGRTVTISGSIRSFPVPAKAKVAENVAGSQEIVVIFSSISPAQVSSFYATALPRAGYSISNNSVLSESGSTVAIIQFSGHGYKGNIDALAHFSDPKVNVAGLGTKNVTTVSLMPK